MEKWVDDQAVARLGLGSSPEEEDDVDDVDVGFGRWQPSVQMEVCCLTHVFLGTRAPSVCGLVAICEYSMSDETS
jgi:hypothetical protein